MLIMSITKRDNMHRRYQFLLSSSKWNNHLRLQLLTKTWLSLTRKNWRTANYCNNSKLLLQIKWILTLPMMKSITIKLIMKRMVMMIKSGTKSMNSLHSCRKLSKSLPRVLLSKNMKIWRLLAWSMLLAILRRKRWKKNNSWTLVFSRSKWWKLLSL